MNEMPVWGTRVADKIYIARCINELKRWGAPLSGWFCYKTVDVREDDDYAPLSKCDLCGCERVRFEHHMDHDDFPFPVVVGCICAGIMEGDILKAKERERLMRNRSKRRKKFVKKPWRQNCYGEYVRRYKNQDITVCPNSGAYSVYAGGRRIVSYKEKPITNLLSAAYAAFDAIDPEVKCK